MSEGPGCVKTRRRSIAIEQVARSRPFHVPTSQAHSILKSKSRISFSSRFELLSFHTAWVKNGSVRVRAARPFYPQQQTSSACPGMSVWCQFQTSMSMVTTVGDATFFILPICDLIFELSDLRFCTPMAKAPGFERKLTLTIEQFVGDRPYPGGIFEHHAVGPLEIEKAGR
jgi:hypothetical protein